METARLVAAIGACAVPVPIVSMEEKSAYVKPAMNLHMGAPGRKGGTGADDASTASALATREFQA